MHKVIKKLIILTLLSPLGTALAQSHGLLINDDSVELRYHSDANDLLRYHTRQEYSAMVAKQGEPRSFHFRADSELLDYTRPFKQRWTMAPKLGVTFSDFLDHRFFAIAAGGVLRRPADPLRKYELLTEMMLGPSDWKIAEGWVWSFKAQVNYPLPDDAEFNFGFRRIDMRVDRGYHHTSFETGLYLGLSKRF